MGGGGFMQHASNTNRQDRAQRSARREKFNGNHSEKTTMSSENSPKLDFSHLSQDQILEERKRIRKVFIKRRKKNGAIFFFALALVITVAAIVYSKVRGLLA
ncbi:MAG: hypothetical protein HRT58_14355 [Crocinitomicaceae bacterium]|nr:hypothetical protein [Crocinitomicaceae bacterium]